MSDMVAEPARVMLRRVAALALLAAGCASYPAAATAAHATRQRTKPVAAIRLQIVSGTPQAAHAYVAPAAPVYVTEFTQPLVVRVLGAKDPKVRFFCVTQGLHAAAAGAARRHADRPAHVRGSDQGREGVDQP